MNPDGSNATRITPGDDDFRDNNVDPAWSPDGRKIAFSAFSARSDEAHISIMNADVSNKINITKVNYSPFLALAPAWSPDGTRIAFSHTTARSTP